MSETSDKEKPQENFLEKQKRSWTIQIENLIKHKYHEALGITEEEYRSTIPEFTSPPPEFVGRFYTTLLIDPCLDLETQLRLMGIENDFDEEDTTLIENAKNVVTPNTPYQIWIQFEDRHKGKTADQLLYHLPKDERGLTAVEGIAFYREHRDLFTKNKAPGARFSIGLAGSVDNNPQYEGSIPQILYWMDNVGRHGEAEMWSHAQSQPNNTGGWPTAGKQ